MKLSDTLVKVVDNRGKTPPWNTNTDSYELIETASLVGGNKYPDYSRIGKWVSQETFDNWFRAGHPIKDDVLIATVGANIGSVAIMKETRGCVAQNLVGFRTNREILNPHYLYYYLSWDVTQQHLKNLDIGAAQPSIKVPHVLALDIPLHPLPIQQKIADALTAYDDLIEVNARRIRVLEAMSQSVYREWFGNVNAKSLPRGWEITTLNKVSKNFDAKRVPLSSMKRAEIQGEYPYYGAAKVLDHINDYIFDGKYLLVAEDGSVITTDGKPVLQMAYGKFWVNNHTHVLQGADLISTEYLYLCLSEVSISGYITGAAQPKINQANLNRIPVILPPKDLLLKANKMFEDSFDMIETLNRQNANLRRTRDLLLPRLVSGEIELQLENE